MRELRSYKNGDTIALIKILSMAAKASKSKLKNMLTAERGAESASEHSDEERFGRLVFDVLLECYESCEDAVIDWFASLCLMTRKEFIDDDDPDLILDVIEAIATRKETKDFLSRASERFKRMFASGDGTKSVAMQS